jgi:hypothetical protein
MPLLASLMFWRRKYAVHYVQTLRKTRVHIQAMQSGPAAHFFQDVLGRQRDVPDVMEGECVQCGNCCMNHQCMFLEQVEPKRYLCGIYHSPFRALSNCGSFPLNAFDIERYACPSYSVKPVAEHVVHLHWGDPSGDRHAQKQII